MCECELIHLYVFQPFSQREITFVNPCLLPCKKTLSKTESTVKGMNLLLGSEFFPLRVDAH